MRDIKILSIYRPIFEALAFEQTFGYINFVHTCLQIFSIHDKLFRPSLEGLHGR